MQTSDPIPGRRSPRARTVRAALVSLAVLLLAGCADLLAVSGLSNLSGFWVGRYDGEIDFYLDLDDDLYGLYGRAGLLRGSTRSGFYVDGVREGNRVVLYHDDSDYGEGPVFEGWVTGRDRIDGVAYLEVIPEPITLRRER
ncbi:MAG TPA: hypothetical protein VHG28_23030 [Longimicrobiaceae bacterium]|nr:hypothetical protein [Longimicrobiaceae bacterium]